MATADKTHPSTADVQRISGPCVWHGNDQRERKDWLRTLSADEIVEIERAVASSQSISIDKISRAAFPLPNLNPALEALRRELIGGRGFALLRGLPVERWSRETTVRAYWGLGLHLGDPVSQNPEGHLLGHVKDIGGDFHDLNSRGGYRSHAALPFHTDIGADLVGLLCLRTAKSGGGSSIVSVAAIYNAMRALRPDLVAELSKPIVRDRRGEVPRGKLPHYSAPVFCLHEGRLTTTFVRRFIDSAPRHEDVPDLTPALNEALDLFESLANQPDLKLGMDFRAGDIQFINNLTLLHARTAFEDFTEPTRKRHLLRLWLAVPDGWPLPEFYYDRFGAVTSTGRPAGMAMAGITPTVPLDNS